MRLRKAYHIIAVLNPARRAELEANPPKPHDIHLRVSRLDPAQAAAWHAHAVAATIGHSEIPTEKGNRQ